MTGDSRPVVVIGAGQAGLATAYHLRRAQVRFAVLEAADRPGAAWTTRWDSLRLFTPRRFSALPESPFPGAPDGYPAGSDVAAYLEAYARDHELPVQCGTTVTSVTPVDEGLRVETCDADGTADARVAGAVIVATGAFQRPRLPACSADLDPDVHSIHSSQYRNPEQLPDGVALVVGAGNSGLQIASELAATAGNARSVHLAVGSRQTELPRRLLGRDIFWWLDRSGLMRAPLHRTPKWITGDGDTLIGQKVDQVVRDGGITEHPRLTSATGRTVRFSDGTEVRVDAVVWATGYRPDYRWVHADIFDSETGRPGQRRGVTSVPGLFFVGMENQYTSASSLLGWVQRDARFVADQAAARCR